MKQAQRVGILGGSFNPIHIGHLRLAVEVLERLQLHRLDIVPCSIPPHKDMRGLLPFALRTACVEQTLRQAPAGLALDTLEQERCGPSYTVETLQAYRQREPDNEFFFLMGAVDLPTLPSWKQGLELPQWTSLVAVPRETAELDTVTAFIASHWPEAQRRDASPQNMQTAQAVWEFAQGTQLIYLPLPRMEVSSTMVRRYWRQGRSLIGLVPEGALAALEQERDLVDNIWGQETYQDG